MHRGAVAVVFGALLLALAGCGGRGFSLPCPPRPGGKLCLTVLHNGTTVHDVIAYLSSSRSSLAGKTWRLVLASDAGSFPGPTRHGDPPVATFCKKGTGQTVTTGNGCHDTLASVYASFGDFSGFHVPAKLSSGTQLCVSEEIRTGGSWAAQTTPAGVCTTVS